MEQRKLLAVMGLILSPIVMTAVSLATPQISLLLLAFFSGGLAAVVVIASFVWLSLTLASIGGELVFGPLFFPIL
jgi:hypothetical protein